MLRNDVSYQCCWRKAKNITLWYGSAKLYLIYIFDYKSIKRWETFVVKEDYVALKMFMLLLMLIKSIMMHAQVHAVPEEDYVALPYNSMERPVINGEDSVPLKFTIS